MGNFAENLNLGNRFRPPPALQMIKCYDKNVKHQGFFQST